MERFADEAEYVLSVLYRMRDEVSANPKLFDLDATERIQEAIIRIQGVIQSTGSELMTSGVKQQAKVA